MAGKHLQFDAGPAPEPVTFSVCEQEFKCMGAAPAALMFRMMELAELDPQADQDVKALAEGIRGFFDGVLLEADRERFWHLAETDDRLSLTLMMDIWKGLVGALAGRPSEPPSRKRDGRSSSGPTSTGARSSAGSTSR